MDPIQMITVVAWLVGGVVVIAWAVMPFALIGSKAQLEYLVAIDGEILEELIKINGQAQEPSAVQDEDKIYP